MRFVCCLLLMNISLHAVDSYEVLPWDPNKKPTKTILKKILPANSNLDTSSLLASKSLSQVNLLSNTDKRKLSKTKKNELGNLENKLKEICLPIDSTLISDRWVQQKLNSITEIRTIIQNVNNWGNSFLSRHKKTKKSVVSSILIKTREQIEYSFHTYSSAFRYPEYLAVLKEVTKKAYISEAIKADPIVKALKEQLAELDKAVPNHIHHPSKLKFQKCEELEAKFKKDEAAELEKSRVAGGRTGPVQKAEELIEQVIGARIDRLQKIYNDRTQAEKFYSQLWEQKQRSYKQEIEEGYKLLSKAVSLELQVLIKEYQSDQNKNIKNIQGLINKHVDVSADEIFNWTDLAEGALKGMSHQSAFGKKLSNAVNLQGITRELADEDIKKLIRLIEQYSRDGVVYKPELIIEYDSLRIVIQSENSTEVDLTHHFLSSETKN